MTSKFLRNFACRKCEGYLQEAVEQKENLCDQVETLRKYMYLDDRESAGEGCEAAVTARTRYWCDKLWECSELQHCRRFPLNHVQRF